MPAPTFVNALTTSYSYSGYAITTGPPTGTAIGDIMLTWVFSRNTSGIVWTASSYGGTKIVQYDWSSLLNVAVFWQRVASVPPYMSYVNSSHAGSLRGAATVTLRGCISTGTPWDFYQKENGVNSNSHFDMTSNTTVGANRLLLAGYICQSLRTFDGGCTYFTEDGDVGVGTESYFSAGVYEYVQASAGATPADSGNMSAGTYKIGVLFGMIPEPSGYENDVIGVSSANIGKVNGVATADIAEVNGV